MGKRFRSGLEKKFADLFPSAPYETTRLPYVVRLWSELLEAEKLKREETVE